MANVALIFLFATQLAGLPSGFEAASVRLSATTTGQDAIVTIEPGRLIARNATLRRLLFEAWQLPNAQLQGGALWLNYREYDVEAVATFAATKDEMMLMLRQFLMERFSMKVHRETRQARVYLLTALPQDAKPRDPGASGSWHFHGDMDEFANVLGIQLTIPLSNDQSAPIWARGSAVPVLNNTGLEGVRDVGLTLRSDESGDVFICQRALREQAGLGLESRRLPVEFLEIDQATKVPLAT